MKDKTFIYSFSEDKYIEYMNKVHLEKQAVNNLLFHEPYISDNMHVRALLCEQHASCYYLEKVLENLEESFSTKNQEFYLTDEQAMRFTILLSSLVQIKEELLKNTVSLSYH